MPFWYIYMTPLVYLLGVASFSFPILFVGGLGAFCIIAIYSFYKFRFLSYIQKVATLSILIALFSFGFYRSSVAEKSYHAKKLELENVSKATVVRYEESVEGYIYDLESESGVRIRLKTLPFVRYSIGDTLEISRPKPIAKDSAYLPYYKSEAIHGTVGYGSPKIIGHDPRYPLAFFKRIAALRDSVKIYIDTVFRPRESELVRGLLLGDRLITSGSYKEPLVQNGVIHIVALSGFNLMLIVGFIGVFFRYKNTYYYASTFIGALVFCIIAGFSPSLLRALLMLGIVYMFRISGRYAYASTALLYTWFLVGMVDPFTVLYSASFHLSSLALFGVLWLGPKVSEQTKSIITKKPVREIFATTVSAWAFTMPYVMYVFSVPFSIRGIFFNILIVPFVAPLTILCICILVLSYVFPFLASPLSYVGTYMVSLFLDFILWS